jgi:hypothetical protein
VVAFILVTAHDCLAGHLNILWIYPFPTCFVHWGALHNWWKPSSKMHCFKFCENIFGC